MKKILSILMFVAVFGILMGSVSAALDMHQHDFDGKCTVDLPDNHWIGDQVPFGKGISGGGVTVHYFNTNHLQGTSIDDYLISQQQYKEVGKEGNLTIYQKGETYAVLTQSGDDYLLVKEKNLDEAKKIASSADFKSNEQSTGSSNNASSGVNNTTSFDKDTVVTIDGLNFTIPEGYKKMGDQGSDHIFANDNSTIIISIKNIGKPFTLDSVSQQKGNEKKVINGTEGILSKESGNIGFTYGIDEYMIGIFAPNEDLIKTVINS